ncbi:P4Hc domain-containing protein [Mycena chlorophos]|uniref:P4Hc domain-containing protein n=1 Tax=Mycena chlorophos TaxID=658473 RepID=A0A8H6W1S2_MYCCL|nr:P4Hc domain-containing protein [Mycena chlorophos]
MLCALCIPYPCMTLWASSRPRSSLSLYDYRSPNRTISFIRPSHPTSAGAGQHPRLPHTSTRVPCVFRYSPSSASSHGLALFFSSPPGRRLFRAMRCLPIPLPKTKLAFRALERRLKRLVSAGVRWSGIRLYHGGKQPDDDDATLYELDLDDASPREGFVLFDVEGTVFKVHTSLLRLDLPALPFAASTNVLGSALEMPKDAATADDFRFFLYDLSILGQHLRSQRARNPYEDCSLSENNDLPIFPLDVGVGYDRAMALRLRGAASAARRFAQALAHNKRTSRENVGAKLLTALERRLRAFCLDLSRERPPLPLPASTLDVHDHAFCEARWVKIWSKAGELALRELNAAMDDERELCLVQRMEPYLRELVSNERGMPMECALAAMELVGDVDGDDNYAYGLAAASS